MFRLRADPRCHPRIRSQAHYLGQDIRIGDKYSNKLPWFTYRLTLGQIKIDAANGCGRLSPEPPLLLVFQQPTGFTIMSDDKVIFTMG